MKTRKKEEEEKEEEKKIKYTKENKYLQIVGGKNYRRGREKNKENKKGSKEH